MITKETQKIEKQKIVKTFAEVVELVKKGDFDYSYRPETLEDLCQEGPRMLTCKGARASETPDFVTREYLPEFDDEKCTQCGTCWVLCPLGVISEKEDGYFNVDEEYCRGCGVCAWECPTQAIEMVRIVK